MKLTKYTNPVSGKEGDITNISGMWQNVLGVAVFIGIFWAGEKIISLFSSKSGVNVQPTQPFTPQQMPPSQPKGMTLV